MYLSLHSPSFAIAEQLFSFTKQRISLFNKTNSINLNKEHPLFQLFSPMKELKQRNVKNYFKRFNSIVKSYLKQL